MNAFCATAYASRHCFPSARFGFNYFLMSQLVKGLSGGGIRSSMEFNGAFICHSKRSGI